MLSQKGASATSAIIFQKSQNVTEAAPFCYASFNCQITKGEFLLLGEAACSFAAFHREEIYGGLLLRFAQKFLARVRICAG
jgi:hypothetical protein